MDKGELAIIQELSALAHMRWRKSCEQQYPDEPPFVSISADVMLDGDEHCVNIYWYPETDEVFVERQD